MNVMDAAERLASLGHPTVTLDPQRCLHSQDQFAECSACFEICPAGALTAGKPPVLDEDRCQACMACLVVCPGGAYQANDDVADLLDCVSRVEGQPVELVCGMHPCPQMGADAVSIGIQIRGCLAGLGKGAYASLATLGVKRISLRTDACARCKWHSLLPEIHHQAEQANLFFSAWKGGATIECAEDVTAPLERPLWIAKSPPLSRRDLFRRWVRQGNALAADAVEKRIAASEYPYGRDRARLLYAVRQFSQPSANPVLNGFGFARLTISETCVACGACGKACPTNALQFVVDEGELTFSLLFSARNCIDCDRCAHVCIAEAITVEDGAPLSAVIGEPPVSLHTGSLARCQDCGALIALREDEQLCSLCKYRRGHPFGSALPQALQDLRKDRSRVMASDSGNTPKIHR